MDRMSDVYEIQKLKARYFRFLDTRQWDRFREVFTDDLEYFREDTMFPEATSPTWRGADALVDYLRNRPTDRVSVHHGHMPEIEFIDEDTATGIWAMYDWVDDANLDGAFQGYGHYHERYVRGADGQWRIASVHLTRIRVDEVPRRPRVSFAFPDPADG